MAASRGAGPHPGLPTNVIEQRSKVLVVDDDVDIVVMISTVLRKRYEVVTASDGKAAVGMLDEHDIAAVIADHMMPGLNGVELLDHCHARRPAAARLLITASDQVNVLKDAVNRARVHRFLSKPLRLTELSGMLGEAIREAHLEADNARLAGELALKNDELSRINERLEAQVKQRTHELQLAVQKLQELALRDGLTGLYNHRFLQEVLEAEVARATRHKHSLGLLFIDVDHFKSYNDHNGHPAGDRLLKMLADVLLGRGSSNLPSQVRRSDIVARYGGEEFVVVLPETTLQGALVKAERIRRTVAAFPFEAAAQQPMGCISVSIGVACFPEAAGDKQQLIDAADRALYAAKHGGRNRVVASAPISVSLPV